jgi:phage anti-repressor protein
MIIINKDGFVEATELYRKIQSKTEYYHWINRKISDADLIEGKDFTSKLTESTGGRPKREYFFSLDACKEICLLERNEKGKQIRRWLINLSNKVESSDLLSHEQILYLVKLKEVFKYVSNCKEAEKIHMNKFVGKSHSRNPFVDFHKMRNDILGLGQEEINTRLKLYCSENHVISKANNKIDKLALINKYEILRNGVWDYLTASENSQSMKLANLVAEMAKLENNTMYRKNEDTLFNKKETDINIKLLSS